MKKLERKQIILLILILLALAYILWQIYDLFGADLFGTSSTPAPAAVRPQSVPMQQTKLDTSSISDESHAVSKEIEETDKELEVDPRSQQLIGSRQANSNGGIGQNSANVVVNNANQAIPPNKNNAQTVSNNASSTNPAALQTMQSAPAVQQQRPAMNPVSAAAPATNTMPMPMLSAQQQQYLNLLNQYQMLRMQRQIVNEKAAIIAAEEKIAEASQKAGSIHQGAYTDDLNASQSGTYKLIYVDNQAGQWTATLSRAGQYYEVVAGDTLPDGTRITRVSRSGVEMIYQKQPYILSFYGMVADTAKASPTEEDQLSAQESLVPQMNLAPASNGSAPNLNTPAVGNSPANSKAPMQSNPANPNNSISPNNMPSIVIPEKKSQTETGLGGPETGSPLGLREEPVKPGIPLTKKQHQTLAVMKSLVGEALPKESGSSSNLAHQETLRTQTETNDSKKSLEIKPLLAAPKTQSSDTRYTIQLIASLNKADVDAFMAANKLEQTARIVPMTRGNKTWYLLVYGDYTQMKEAEAEMSKLPKTLKAKNPWVRPLAQIDGFDSQGTR